MLLPLLVRVVRVAVEDSLACIQCVLLCIVCVCVCVSMCVHYTPVPGFIGSCSSLEPVCSELNYHHTALMYRRDEAYICHRIALLTRVHFIVKSCTDSETLTHYVNWRKD